MMIHNFSRIAPLQNLKPHIMKQSLSTLVLLCILHTISAQPSEYELLKEFNGKEIRMLSESDELTFYAIKNRKRGKWGIVYTVQSTDEEYESMVSGGSYISQPLAITVKWSMLISIIAMP
jgi:hypothetical protein